jgi:hypothetical protein
LPPRLGDRRNRCRRKRWSDWRRAAYCSQQGQDGREDAHRAEDADNAASGHGDTTPAAVEPPAAVPAPTAVPILASRHGDLRQAALAFLDAWYARADDSDNSEDTLNGRSPLSARPWQQGFADPLGRSFTPSEGDKAGAGSGHAAPSRRCQRTGDRGENGLGLPHGSRLPCRPGKKGVQVDVLERVRQTDPNKQRARESHTVYRFAGETAQ